MFYDIVIIKENGLRTIVKLFGGDNRTLKSVDIINTFLESKGFTNLLYDFDYYGVDEMEISNFMYKYELALKGTGYEIEWIETNAE
jgi:hypothetical protein